MKCLNRNRVKFYYSLYKDEIPVLDEYGNHTGEYEIIYGKPTEGKANISAATGETEVFQFGEGESYDKVIVMDSDHPNIDEYSILWVDTIPELTPDGELAKDESGTIKTPHDYAVKKVAKSLNSVSYAISKVKVRG